MVNLVKLDITNSFDGMCVRFGSNQESAKNTASAIYWGNGFTAMIPNLILTIELSRVF